MFKGTTSITAEDSEYLIKSQEHEQWKSCFEYVENVNPTIELCLFVCTWRISKTNRLVDNWTVKCDVSLTWVPQTFATIPRELLWWTVARQVSAIKHQLFWQLQSKFLTVNPMPSIFILPNILIGFV